MARSMRGLRFRDLAAAALSAGRHLAWLVAAWAGRRRQRRALARLNDQLLADIGVDAAAADAESRRPFWR